MKRLTRLLVALALVALPALPALAKSFHIAGAQVDIVVEPDGSLLVTEYLSYDFDGSFTGAYRDIPVRAGETFEFVSIGDDTITYDPGGCVVLGCSSPPGTYGLDLQPGLARVVWHHSSHDELRTFKLVYRMSGVIFAYDDVADLQYKVWGDQWSVRADEVTATVILPSEPPQDEIRVWGHPFNVDGTTSAGSSASQGDPNLTARDVPAYQWVEIRYVFPTSTLESTSGAVVVPGDGLEKILDTEAEFAEEANDARAAAGRGLVAGIGAFLVITFGAGGAVYLRYGKEPNTGYDREYEQFPPSELTPAEVGVLVSQGHVDEKQFTATLFDLIRKGAITAEPSDVQRVTWAGLRTEQITDLVLGLGEGEPPLRDFEQSVMTVLRRALALGPRPLHELNEAITEDRASNAQTYKVFRDRVLGAVRRGKLLDDTGHGVSWLVRIGAIGLVVAGLFFLPRAVGDRPGSEAFVFLLMAGLIGGAVILFILLSFRRVRTRRTREGALEAERWLAFRRYLTDFSRLEEAPSISLALWDQFLIYGITFGVAEQVLEQARLHAPEELHQTSNLYWYGHHGYGGGPTQNAFVGLESALSGAFTPPSSSGGGGGGFSGGGGGGSGGGGGGAW